MAIGLSGCSKKNAKTKLQVSYLAGEKIQLFIFSKIQIVSDNPAVDN